MTSNGKDSKMDVLEMRPIPALRNSIPYNCLEVYEKNKREEMQHCGDFKYLMDYVKRVLKWHQRAISRPEVARYTIPELRLPVYLAQYYFVTEMVDKNFSLRKAQKFIRLQFIDVKPPDKTPAYFEQRDKEFKYECYVTNERQRLAKHVKRVENQEEVNSIEDNQYLLYHRAVTIWESIQEQAQAKGDVSESNRDPNKMFPISRFSHILVDTPPLPIPAKYDQLVKDVNEFKRILHEQGKDSEIEKGDADMVISPSERQSTFGLPNKWRRVGRLVAGDQTYP